MITGFLVAVDSSICAPEKTEKVYLSDRPLGSVGQEQILLGLGQNRDFRFLSNSFYLGRLLPPPKKNTKEKINYYFFLLSWNILASLTTNVSVCSVPLFVRHILCSVGLSFSVMFVPRSVRRSFVRSSVRRALSLSLSSLFARRCTAAISQERRETAETSHGCEIRASFLSRCRSRSKSMSVCACLLWLKAKRINYWLEESTRQEEKEEEQELGGWSWFGALPFLYSRISCCCSIVEWEPYS